ncbi:MAG: OmpA family protein [Proteobacteria bacterium]|nr:OmpA family protein [Pseudomonadota bacterium]
MAKTVFALIFTLIVSVVMPPPVSAASARESKLIPATLGGFSLTPTIGGYFFAGSEQRNATQTYGIKIGYDIIEQSLEDSLGVEGTFNYFTTTSNTGASNSPGYLFRLDAIYPFILRKKWVPFFAVGIGGIVIDSDSHTETSPLLNYGAGVKYFLEDYLAVRADVRHLLISNNDSTRNNFEVGIGLSYYFGKERKKTPVPPATRPKEKEADKKEKKATSTANNSTSAIPVLEDTTQAAAGKAGEEKKPAQQTTLAVAPTPLSLPTSVKTAPSVRAEGTGYKITGKKEVRKLTVEFDINRSDIKPKYYKELKQLADIIKNSSDASVLIEGHTDSAGKLSYNMMLSKLRAQSVQKILEKLGVDTGRISTVGYGPARPIADNTKIAGRPKNRRAITIVTLKERAAQIETGQDRPDGFKQGNEPGETKRRLAEKQVRENINAVITLHEGTEPVSVGSNGRVPFEISNKGKSSEDFLLTVTAPKEYHATLTRALNPDENGTRLHLAAGETFRGTVLFKMPAEMVDGHRSVILIKAVSTKFNDISFQKEAVVISSAPFVRAVAKLSKQKVTPGEELRYRITLLNAGSLSARNLTVRLQLPPQVEFLGSTEVPFIQEPDGTLVFAVDHVNIGKLAHIDMDVKIREDSASGQELRGRVEVNNNSLHRKAIFTATASVIQAKQQNVKLVQNNF